MSSPRSNSLRAVFGQATAAATLKPRRIAVPTADQGLHNRTVSLTPAAEETLARILDAAQGTMGRRANASAAIRALLSCLELDGPDSIDRVVAAMEAELNSGTVVWGRQR